jgi:cell division protein FtsI (penicillin-binding protein 3)
MVSVLLLVIGGRLVQLQAFDHADYAGAAAAQRVKVVPVHALRGAIVDRNGTPLAFTSGAQDITADPTQVAPVDRLRTAVALAPLLAKPVFTVMAELAKPGQYSLLGTALDSQTARQIEDLNLAGIYTQPTTQREYPGQTTAANVIGLVQADGTGAAGIEQQYNEVLAGRDGTLTYAVDGRGRINPNGPNVTRNAVDGGTVRLTLDQDLQYTVQSYLDSAVAQSQSRGGQVAVLDAHNGQVLALASSGTFNPANPATITDQSTRNPAVQSVFEPGSVNKVVTFSAALEHKLITPSTVVDVPDTIEMGGISVHDAWSHPAQKFTATGVLAASSNVGTLKIAQRIGPATWDEYERGFGIGAQTGIELPSESAGILPPMTRWSDATYANLPIGQGEAMTIVQMASMYQTIANDGIRVPPRIVTSVTRSDGSTEATPTPDGTRIVSAATARTVRTMLESTILPGGTGVKAAVPGYRVAGKTGTAQQPDPARGGAYSDSMYWDTFAGIAPADNPQFVVAVMIDNPAHGLHGGDVAAPLFNEIGGYYLQHARIPPSGSSSVHVPLLICDAPTRAQYGSSVC